jgi:hypothetical protein
LWSLEVAGLVGVAVVAANALTLLLHFAYASAVGDHSG